MSARQVQPGVPVVVVGESLNCLGVLRSLAPAGMPLHVVTTTRWCAAGLSRFAHLVRLPSLQGRALVDGLKALSTRIGQRPVLMLGGDREVATVNEARDELAPFYRFTLPPAEVVRTLADKADFHAFAQRHGLPVPRTEIFHRGEAPERLGHLALPLVIKPADKAQVLAGHADRALRVDTRAQADDALLRMTAAAGSVVVQEWIEGDDTDIYFALFVCDRDSVPVAIFCGRKLVCFPPAVGSTGVCCEAGAATPDLAAACRQFVAASGYQGIGSVEFKRDRRNGRFMIVEPTVGRTDWQEEIATLCGVNLPLQAYLAELGLPAATSTPPAGGLQAWSSSVFHPRPHATLPAGTRIRDGYLRLNDPLPGMHHYLVDQFARRALRRVARVFRLDRARRVPSSTLRSSRP